MQIKIDKKFSLKLVLHRQNTGFGYVAVKASDMNQSDQQSEWEYESLKLKRNIEILKISMLMKVKDRDRKVEGVNNACR